MTDTRECDWCGSSLTQRKPDATTCGDTCRLTLSKWRRGIGPFTVDGPGHVDGRSRPHNPVVAREHRDRDGKRAARRRGPIASDLRLQRSAAIDACVAAMRLVARVPVADARVIATVEVDKRMPGGCRV